MAKQRNTVKTNIKTQFSLDKNHAAYPFFGTIDFLNKGILAGWIANVDKINEPVEVDIYVNNRLLLKCKPNINRVDINKHLGILDKNVKTGFKINVIKQIKKNLKKINQHTDDKPYVISAFVRKTKVELNNSPLNTSIFSETSIKRSIKQKNQEKVDEHFDWAFYNNYYDDISFNNEIESRQHWLEHGRKERRFPNCKQFLMDFISNVSEEDIASFLNFDEYLYLDLNPDLKLHFNGNKFKLFKHYVLHGKKELRNYQSLSDGIHISNYSFAGDSEHSDLFKAIASIHHKIVEEKKSTITQYLPSGLNSVNVVKFADTSLLRVKTLIEKTYLKRTDTVLDINAKNGELAFGLLDYLNQKGTYLGLVFDTEIVASLQETYRYKEKINGQFKFSAVEKNYGKPSIVVNNRKNLRFKFPKLKEKFDRIVIFDFFNNHLACEIENLIVFASKNLSEKGLMLITLFLIGHDFFSKQKKGEFLDIKKGSDDCYYYHYPDALFCGQTLEYVENILYKHGLKILKIINGHWIKKENMYSDKDLLIVSRV